MRASGPQGLRLVLCTADGTQEVFLTDAGEVIPVEEDAPDHSDPHCIQVSAASTEKSPAFERAHSLPLWSLAVPQKQSQLVASKAIGDSHAPRAPPRSI